MLVGELGDLVVVGRRVGRDPLGSTQPSDDDIDVVLDTFWTEAPDLLGPGAYVKARASLRELFRAPPCASAVDSECIETENYTDAARADEPYWKKLPDALRAEVLETQYLTAKECLMQVAEERDMWKKGCFAWQDRAVSRLPWKRVAKEYRKALIEAVNGIEQYAELRDSALAIEAELKKHDDIIDSWIASGQAPPEAKL